MPYKDKAQRNAYARKWAAENKEKHGALVAKNNARLRSWWKEYKSILSCIKCGESHPACIDFHHRDPSEKEFSIHKAIGDRIGKPRVLAELAKCDVLCANCHRKVHAEMLGQ